MKKIRSTYLSTLLFAGLSGLLLWACDSWEIPTKKTQRNCTTPSGSLDAQIQQRKVDFTISASTGTIDQVNWDFGNGSTTVTTGMTVSNTYPTSGTYTVKATLSNTCQQTTTLQRTIIVSDAVAPTVSLQTASDISTTTAILRMAVTSTGNATITQYGICYSNTNTSPDKGNGSPVFITGSTALNTAIPFSLTGLQPNTTYYVRSFATNSAGLTGYSIPTQTFQSGVSPSVSINGTPTVGVTTASMNFVLTNAGTPAAVQYGIVYSSTTSTPDITAQNALVNSPNVGANTLVNLTDLNPNTTYYYRPYAMQANGQAPVYGTISSFTTLADPVANGLIASISFTDKSLLDATPNANNVILVDSPTFTTDRKGKANAAIQLDGINDYFYMAENNSLRPDALTVSIWIRPNAINNVNDRMQIYNKSRWNDSAFEMYSSLVKINENGPGLTFMTNIKQNSNCQIANGWQAFQFSNNPQLGAWHHLVYTYSGKSSRMYFDNVLMDQNDNLPATSLDKCPGGELKFGAQIITFPNYFSGAMDDIRIYNRALSASEVQTLYNQ